MLSWSVRWLAVLLAITTTLLDGLGTRVLLRSLLIGYALCVTTISATAETLYEIFWVAKRLLGLGNGALSLAFGMVVYGFSPTTAGSVWTAYRKRLVLATGGSALTQLLLGGG